MHKYVIFTSSFIADPSSASPSVAARSFFLLSQRMNTHISIHLYLDTCTYVWFSISFTTDTSSVSLGGSPQLSSSLSYICRTTYLSIYLSIYVYIYTCIYIPFLKNNIPPLSLPTRPPPLPQLPAALALFLSPYNVCISISMHLYIYIYVYIYTCIRTPP